jgi:fatty-acyl-CoA synthase
VKAPKQVELWQQIPRSRVGKVLKADVRSQLLRGQGHTRP